MVRNQSNHGPALLSVVLLLAAGYCLQCDGLLIREVFGRRDIFWVALASASPFAYWLSVQKPPLGIGLLVWFLSAIGVVVSLTADVEGTFRPFYRGLCGNVCLAILVSLPISMRVRQKATGLSGRLGAGSLMLLMAFFLPGAYANSVSKSIEEELAGSLSSNRLVRAYDQTSVLLAIDPAASIFGTPVVVLNQELEQSITRLTAQADSTAGSSAAIGQRVIALMQLERNQEALELLESLAADPQSAPVAYDYCGLCCQRLKQYEESKQWYLKSRDFWNRQPPSPRRSQALLSAYKGIAFAERRLDHPLAAEAAYRDALVIAPTPELHFLLAKHYEEQQQTAMANTHVRKAMMLDPSTYQSRGKELIDKMSLSHFGCFNIR